MIKATTCALTPEELAERAGFRVLPTANGAGGHRPIRDKAALGSALAGHEDPRAHLGLTVPGFPNFFVLSGLNSVPQHGAGINILSEAQSNLAIGCLDLMLSHHGSTIEPKQDAFEAYNDRLDRQLDNMIWGHPRVKSYYQNSKGRLYLSSPWRIVNMWQLTRKPDPEHFSIGAAGSSSGPAAPQ